MNIIHFFRAELAVKYGVEEAILLENISFWITKNAANNKHFYDGHYWTYNSYEAFSKLFPYLSIPQIKRILKSLEDQGAIKTGNYNKIGYDRTKWYTIIVPSIVRNRPFDETKSSDGTDEIVPPIPYINTDIITDTPSSAPSVPVSPSLVNNNTTPLKTVLKHNTEENFEKIWAHYPRKMGKKGAFRSFKASAKSLKDLQDMALALQNYRDYLKVNETEEQFIQHGSTWFNNWRDWLAVKVEPKKEPAGGCGVTSRYL